MFSTLLVPLDGSLLSEQAMPYAMAVARETNGKLILLYVAPALGWDAPALPARDATARLEVIATQVRAVGLAAQTLVCDASHPETGLAIAQAAREQHADLIVMSTHGRSGVERAIFGSVANQVLHNAEVPVLLVPTLLDRRWSEAGPRRILVPLDGSEFAKEALDPAGELAQAAGGELLLLHVVESPAVVSQADSYLDELADALRSMGRTVAVRTEVGDPAVLIARVAREEEIDLIAMATHGRSGLARLVMGSVATATVRRTGVPLLLERPASMRRPAAEPARTQDAAVE